MHCEISVRSVLKISLIVHLATGQVNIWLFLSGGQVKILRFFYPCDNDNNNLLISLAQKYKKLLCASFNKISIKK